MNHLFVIRHGEYGVDYNLDDIGRQQIESLVEQMKKIVGEIKNGFYLLSSTAPRAEQTAEIIAQAFGLEGFAKDKRLFTEGGYIPNSLLEEIDGMISPHRETTGVIALSTHYEVVKKYPMHFLKKEFGREERIRGLDTGEGVHFDLEARTYQIISG